MDRKYLEAFMPPPDTFIGFDIGKQRDPSALCTVQKVYIPLGEPYNVSHWRPSRDLVEAVWGIKEEYQTARVGVAREYRILDMQTLGLGANYTEQITQAVSYIRDVMVKVNRGICVVPDKTGAGDAVTDTLAQGLGEAKLPYPLTLRPIHIKPSGSYTLNTHSGYNVSIADIIHNAAVLFQQGQVHIAADIPTIHRAIKELQRFKIKKTRGGGETYEAWREGDHDDLVFSLALPLWVAEKRLGYPAYVDLKGHVIADAPVNIRERH